MARATRPVDERFTWKDYKSWPDDERWEMIGGQAYAMSPPPSTAHQKILLKLAMAVEHYFSDKDCSVMLAPTGLKLSEEDVVQPDLLVYCNPNQDKGSHIEGAPALVVEVLSPSSQQHDRMRKHLLYARHGVPEYWIVSPADQILEVLRLNDGAYTVAHVFGPDDDLASPSFAGMQIPLSSVFVTPPYPDQVRESVPPYGHATAGAKPQAEQN